MPDSAFAKRIVALIAAAISLGIALFQILLALGLPYGTAAWGGFYQTLPTGLRFASAGSALVLMFAAWLAMARSHVIKTPIRARSLQLGCFAFATMTTLSTLGNLASSSATERTIMLPFAATSPLSWWILVI